MRLLIAFRSGQAAPQAFRTDSSHHLDAGAGRGALDQLQHGDIRVSATGKRVGEPSGTLERVPRVPDR